MSSRFDNEQRLDLGSERQDHRAPDWADESVAPVRAAEGGSSSAVTRVAVDDDWDGPEVEGTSGG